MLERLSALQGHDPIDSAGVRLVEEPGFSLLQLSGVQRSAHDLIGNLPESVGQAIEREGRTLMKVGRSQYWIISGEQDDLGKKLAGAAILVPLSHSRTRLRLEGIQARAVLARSAAVDFHASAFAPGQFALTGIHHTPVLIHCIAAEAFHVYAMRTFALSLWEWLADAAAGC